MTVEVRRGADLFGSTAEALVITVNCVGVMGKGVALTAKQRDPDLFREYQAICHAGRLRLGAPVLIRRLVGPSYLLFPTKGHWRDKSDVRSILAGLDYIEASLPAWRLAALAVPPLGCGNGGLEWAIVAPLFLERLARLGVRVELHPPQSAQDTGGENDDAISSAELRRALASVPAGSVAALSLLRALRSDFGPLDRSAIQSLWYTAQIAGVVDGWAYQDTHTGPACRGLSSHLSSLVRNGLLCLKTDEGRRRSDFELGPAYRGYAALLAQELERFAEPLGRLTRLLRQARARDLRLIRYLHWIRTGGLLAPRTPSAFMAALAATSWPDASRYSESRVSGCLEWLARSGWLDASPANGC